ncbi:Calpain catalytic domain-containing protein [Mycena venus]|uniref:Calpain catalytic domain-containing protein n=1 Tax=Mycena venus TaxID=2733690 RepID=A0A8H6XSH8_9AGAR|nr:Calpain catalytic domain-containing protein [Mycena venus]
MNVLDLFKSMTAASQPVVQQAAFVQQEEKAGLLVTEELDKALEEAKAKVARIAKECRLKNRKFRDIEFDLENDREKCLHGLGGGMFSPSDVQRATDIFENARFFVDGASSNDIVQGAIGDCWFVSALATMSTCPGLIEKFCVARDEQVGVYGFVFFRDMRWVSVVIDDLLYTSIPKYEELSGPEKQLYHNDKDRYIASARKGSKTLYFARSSQEGETWIPLIEKAYAKLHGDYASLSGGEACEAIEDLTGAVSSFIPSKDILDIDKFWTEELLKANKDRLFGCAFNGLDGTRSGDWDATINGLHGNHAYSVLRAVEVKGKRFLVVRNPWGESEWTGPWSDGSKEWTPEWLAVLPELNHSFGDDGQFVMEYKDFLASWSDIDRTILFDSSWVMSSHWLEVTTRAAPAAWSFGDVSFTISMPKPSHAMIVLSQLDARRGETEAVAESLHARYFSRSVNLEIPLEAGEYVVHVRIDRMKYREKDYFETASVYWDEQKLARVMTERARSQAIASNFKADTQADSLPIPLSILAGQTLTQLEEKAAATAAALKAATGKEEKPVTTTTKTTKTTVTTVVVTTGGDSAETVVAPTPKVGDSKPKKDDDSVVADDVNPDDLDDTSDSSTSDSSTDESTKKGFKDPADRGSIFLGLRVYTNRDAPAVIGGQLRHEMNTSFAGLAVTSV